MSVYIKHGAMKGDLLKSTALFSSVSLLLRHFRPLNRRELAGEVLPRSHVF